MRQRASTKTQRRLKQQQQRDPYALTDDVYDDKPTFHVGGLVTAVGVLQLVVALALSGFVFGGALLLCVVVLTALGLALLHRSDAKRGPHGLGLKQAIGQLLALRRGALDYSLTLSIAQSEEYQKKELQIAVVPSSPTPQNVVATMALKREEPVQQRKTRLADDAPLVTLNRVDMKALPTINSFHVEQTEELCVEKPRANSEPKQVLRSRPLLPLKPKVQPAAKVNATQEKKKKKTQVKATSMPLRTMEKEETKTPQVQVKTQPKVQQLRKKPEPKVTQVAAKTQVLLPTVLPKVKPMVTHVAAKKEVLPKAEPKVFVPTLPKPEPVAQLSKSKPVGSDPATVIVKPFVPETVVPAVAPLPVFPQRKTLVEISRGEPAIERELVVTRNVLLYLNPESESVMELEEQEMEHELKQDQELESFILSTEAFPPLSPPMVPQAPMPVPVLKALEPNFLMDIDLEPISKPERKLISFSSLRHKPVGNAELCTMLDELDVMRLELDAAMARCTSLLNGVEDKVSAPSSPETEPEEEPIFCF